MSHFSLIVTGKQSTIEQQLAPFNECPGRGSRYLQWVDETEAIQKRYQKKVEEAKKKGEEMAAFLLWVEDYFGDSLIMKEGRYGRIYNPNAKWDWWEIGGRWDGQLRSVQGEDCNSLLLKD